MQIVSIGDNLHKMSILFSVGNINLSSPELAKRVVKVKTFDMSLMRMTSLTIWLWSYVPFILLFFPACPNAFVNDLSGTQHFLQDCFCAKRRPRSDLRILKQADQSLST